MFDTAATPWLSRRLFAVLFLGFFSGLPLFLTSSTLQAWFATTNIPITQIGLLSLVGTPYLFKFCWAPLLDKWVPPLLGRRRGWIFVTQFFLVLGLLFMARLAPETQSFYISVVALIIAICAATQDIGINAYQADILHESERGTGAAMYVFGYRVAMLVSGGLALIFADHYGWQATYTLMGILMFVGLFFTWFSPETEDLAVPKTWQEAIVDPFKQFLSRDKAWMILFGILLYKFGDNFVIALNSAFFLRKLHFTLEQVGLAYKFVGFAATIAGLFIGGYILSKIKLYRSLLLFGVLQSVSSFLYVALALMGKNYAMMLIAVTGESLCLGLGTAALIAWLMSLCDHRYTATQFALFSALSSVSRVITGPISGYMVKAIGWPLFFTWGAVAAIPGLILIYHLRHTFRQSEDFQT